MKLLQREVFAQIGVWTPSVVTPGVPVFSSSDRVTDDPSPIIMLHSLVTREENLDHGPGTFRFSCVLSQALNAVSLPVARDVCVDARADHG